MAFTRTQIGIAVSAGALLVLVFVVGLSLAAKHVGANLPNMEKLPTLGTAFERIGSDWIRLALFAAGGAALLLWRSRERFAIRLAAGALLLVAADLFWVGINLNPTARPEMVYPITTGIKYLQEKSGHERIFPVNQRWSLYSAPPAIFPPNAATVYGLRDVQGYDSLFTGQYKVFANRFALPRPDGGADASPPEVGNIVFFQNPNASLVPQTAAAFALTLPPGSPGYAQEAVPPGAPIDTGDEAMAISALPASRPRAELLSEASNTVVPPPLWKEDLPTRVTLETDVPVPTTLILRDQLTPGWTATVDGQTVTFPAVPRLDPKQAFEYHVTAKGAAPGDARVTFVRTSRDIPAPTSAEESTRVY